jgi:hypothetical protein
LGVPAGGRDEVCFFPLAGAGGVGVLLALGGDDGEGARGGGDDGEGARGGGDERPPKSQSSSLSEPGSEGGSTKVGNVLSTFLL